MSVSSRIPGFYDLSREARLEVLRAAVGASAAEPGIRALVDCEDFELLDRFIENAVGGYTLPLGIAVNFLVDGQDLLVPMAIEESSVVAAASNMARIVRSAGGFVTEAVDVPGSSGRGFVTEYAGPSSLVSTQNILDRRWEDLSFAHLQPQEATNRLFTEGLLSCGGAGCESPHPQVLPILRNHLPAPEGVSEGDYYTCIDCFDELATWNGQAFQDDFYERIVLPAQHALEVLRNNPYLTRIYTTMSPMEMTEDPMFHVVADLEPVSAQHTVTVNTRCDGQQVAIFDDGREIGIGSGWTPNNGQPWPILDGAPAAETVTDHADPASPDSRVDNTDSINLLAAASVPEYAPEALSGEDTDGGCGCRAANTGSPYGTVFGGLALVWFLRRRRSARLNGSGRA